MVRALYNFIIIIAFIPYILIIILRKYKGKEHPTKYKEKIFYNNFERPDGFLLWFHVASLGEFNSILPIIDFYLKKSDKYKFLITTVTLSSYTQFEKKFAHNKRVFHQFLPYDVGFLVKNFLDKWSPDIVSFVDSEIWPNFISQIKNREIPFILLNARITKKTFKRWMYFKRFAYEIFNSFTLCIASSNESEKYLNQLNVKNIKNFGNVKFCTRSEKDKIDDKNQFNSIKNKKVWVALSTHEDEELFCCNVQEKLEKADKDFVSIIIPRHIGRIKKIYTKLSNFNKKIQIKNENDNISEDAKIVLVNYYGLTSKYLNKFKQVFIGKSMIPSLSQVGGQNPIDAIKMGCKVYHGPFVYNFKEIYDYLDINNFSEQISGNRSECVELLAKKIISDLEISSKSKMSKIEKFNIFSDRIFNNVIQEYDKVIK